MRWKGKLGGTGTALGPRLGDVGFIWSVLLRCSAGVGSPRVSVVLKKKKEPCAHCHENGLAWAGQVGKQIRKILNISRRGTRLSGSSGGH